MERKLASIRKIDKLEPIEGADRIELAHVGGWKVVVAKNVGHSEGDFVVYCEVDSFLPIEDQYEFLRKSSYKKMGDGTEGFRLKTIKLRGQISQGLIIPMEDVKHKFDFGNENFSETIRGLEGQDVSEILGITKYEPPVPAQLQGVKKGTFPSHLFPKTNEERVQNLTKEFSQWVKDQHQHQFYITEKLDGTSFSCYINNGEFGICSRNMELKENENNTYWRVAKEMGIEEKLRSRDRNLALQGELIGENIQGNSYQIKGQTIKFFTAYGIDTQEKLGYEEFHELMEFLDLQSIPVPAVPGVTLPDNVDDMLKLAEGKSELNGNTEREGIVVRDKTNNISFKVISNKFLLKNG